MIAIEKHADPQIASILDDLSTSLTAEGYPVVRWDGLHSSDALDLYAAQGARLLIVWDGLSPAYMNGLDRFCQRQVAHCLYLSRGLLNPDRFQLDPQGIDTLSSWLTPFTRSCSIKMPPDHLPLEGHHLTVILQDPRDPLYKNFNPWFESNLDFLMFMHAHSRLPIAAAWYGDLEDEALDYIRKTNLPSSMYDEPFDNHLAVATVNSQSALRHLQDDKPVLCYGTASYRHVGVVGCLDNHGPSTSRATAFMASHRSCPFVSRSRVRRFLNEMKKHEFTISDVLDQVRDEANRLEIVPGESVTG